MGAVTTAFVQQYKDNITQLVQQKTTKLRPTVRVDTDFTGEYKFYDQLGASEMVQKTSRNQDTPSIDPDHKRRRIGKADWLHNVLLDKEDQLSMIVDPKSAYSVSASRAAGRKIDDVIIAAYNATAYTGKTGTTETTFAAANQIAVAGTGLTKNKLLNAKRLLDNNDVEMEDRFCVATPLQIEDLLKTTEVTSVDYNSVRALVNGEINTWIGFQFVTISTSRLGTDDSGSRLIYCYHRDAMQLAIQKEPSVRIDERPDKNYLWQVFMSMTIGATRLEEERIVQIACSES
jgi:hypothetical protein